VGTFPLLFQLDGMSFTDAYFEMMSGLTTTGATVLSGLDKLPVSINFWRCFLEWIGGMGVVVLAVAILPMLGVGGRQAFKAETPGPMKDAQMTSRIQHTARGLWLIYVCITVACIVGLLFAGMGPMDAVLHAFTTVSLGGFSSHDNSYAFFNSVTAECITIFFMLIAGINFATHFLFFTKRNFKFYKLDQEAHAFWKLMVVASLVVAFYLWNEGVYDNFFTALRHASFNVISVATTTGFTSVDYNQWPMFAPIFMLFLSCFSTCAGSTGGGVKMIRAQLLLRQAHAEMRRLIHPNAQIMVKLNQQTFGASVLYSILAFVFIYGASIIFLTLLMLLSDAELITAITAVISCINGLGPGLSQVGPSGNFQVLTDFQTWICSFAMLLGRLELFTLLVVLTPDFWRR
jgi:trk system potassium uptake protein TrkH